MKKKVLIYCFYLLLLPVLTAYSQSDSIDELLAAGKYDDVLQQTSNYLENGTHAKQRINALVWLSRKAAGENNYKKSIQFLKEIQQIGKDLTWVDKIDKNWDLNEEIEIIEKMGKVNTNNAFEHKLLVIFLKESGGRFFLDRDNHQKYLEKKLAPEIYEKTKLFFEYQKKYVEVFSHGGLRLQVDYIDKDLALKGAQTNPNGAINEIDLSRIEPQKTIRTLFYDKLPQYDTFVFIWAKPEEAKTQAYGGKGLSDQLVPYQMYGPSRGFFVIPDTWIRSMYTRSTFIHEFFHTLEHNAGFGPPHAWYKSRNESYPEYSGLGEYAYYQKRFDDIIKEIGWHNINWRKRFPLNAPKEMFQKNLSLLLSKGVETLEKADSLYQEGKKEFTANRDFSAKKLFLQALKINPLHSYALYRLAEIAYKEKDYDQALAYCEKILAVDPDTPDTYILMVRSARDKGDYKKAIELLTAGFKDNPEDFTFRIKAFENMRLILSYAEKEKQDMLTFYDLFLKMKESDEVYRARGHYYLNRNNMTLAIRDFKKALQLRPQNPDNHIALGKALWYDKKYQSARAEFDQALKNSRYPSRKISNHFITASYWERKTDLKKELLDLAIQYDKNNPRAYETLAKFYDNKDKNLAILNYKLASDLGSEKALKTLKANYSITYTPQSPQKPPHSIKIAVYDVYGFDDLSYITDIFYGYPEYELVTIHSKDILKDKLKGFQVIIVPGGNPRDYGNPLGKEGLEIIKNFVKKGGKYIGICAGAYFGLSEDFLHLFNGKPFNSRYWFRGMGDLEISLTDEGKAIFGDMSVPIILRYANGTMIERMQLEGSPDFTILANFKSGFAQNGAPNIMPGLPAVITAPYGKGKALIFSPHPEYSAGRSYMIRKAVEYLMR